MNKLVKIFSIASAIGSSFLLGGCAEYVAAGGLGAATVYLGYQHSKVGGIKHRFTNFYLESAIKSLWAEAKLDEPFLDVIAVYGVPVIVGAALSKDNLEKAKALAFMKADNVQCLANDIKPGSWNVDLALSVRAKMLIDFDIASRNYHVMAIKKQVFVVGIAEDEAEKKAVLNKLAKMDGIQILRHYIIVLKEDQKDNGDGYVLHKG